MDNCHLLQKYTQTPEQLFCNFYKSVGHDEYTCRNYELMMGQTPTYRMQIKMRALDPDARMACIDFKGEVEDEVEWTRKGPWTINLLQLQRTRALCPRLYQPNE